MLKRSIQKARSYVKNFQPYIYNYDKEITPEQDAILSPLRFASTTEVKDDKCQKCPEMSLTHWWLAWFVILYIITATLENMIEIFYHSTKNITTKGCLRPTCEHSQSNWNQCLRCLHTMFPAALSTHRHTETAEVPAAWQWCSFTVRYNWKTVFTSVSAWVNLGDIEGVWQIPYDYLQSHRKIKFWCFTPQQGDYH